MSQPESAGINYGCHKTCQSATAIYLFQSLVPVRDKAVLLRERLLQSRPCAWLGGTTTAAGVPLATTAFGAFLPHHFTSPQMLSFKGAQSTRVQFTSCTKMRPVTWAELWLSTSDCVSNLLQEPTEKRRLLNNWLLVRNKMQL